MMRRDVNIDELIPAGGITLDKSDPRCYATVQGGDVTIGDSVVTVGDRVPVMVSDIYLKEGDTSNSPDVFVLFTDGCCMFAHGGAAYRNYVKS